jgi:hypothetical protein
MFEIPKALQRQHEIIDLVAHHGLTQVERILEVHRTTIGRWCKGQIPVPIMAIVALRALKGDFPRFNPSAKAAWAGWRFEQDGNLYEPNGTPHTAIEISGIHWQVQLIATLNQRIKQLETLLNKGNIQHGIVVTANDTFEDADHPVAKLLEANYQLKRKPRSRR